MTTSSRPSGSTEGTGDSRHRGGSPLESLLREVGHTELNRRAVAAQVDGRQGRDDRRRFFDQVRPAAMSLVKGCPDHHWAKDRRAMADEALVRAVNGYDAHEGDFVNYLMVTVARAVNPHLTDDYYFMRKDTGDVYAILCALGRHRKIHWNCECTLPQLAEALHVSEDDLRFAKAVRRTLSMDTPLGEGSGASLGELIAHGRHRDEMLRNPAAAENGRTRRELPTDPVAESAAQETGSLIATFRDSLPDDWTRILFDLRLGRVIADTDERPLSVPEAVAKINRTQTRKTNPLDLMLRERILRRDQERHLPFRALLDSRRGTSPRPAGPTP